MGEECLPMLDHHLFHVLQHLDTLQPQQPGQQDKDDVLGGPELGGGRWAIALPVLVGEPRWPELARAG
jgi:hypothetical protein